MFDKTGSKPSRIRLPIIAGLGALISTAVCLFLFFASGKGFVNIGDSERGVLISAIEPTGYHTEVLEPGVHFFIPFLEEVRKYSIAPQTYAMAALTTTGQSAEEGPIVAQSKDRKQVEISISVVYSINPAEVIDLHISWQNRYEADLIRPMMRGITQDVVSKYYSFDFTGFYRKQIEQAIKQQLSTKLSENSIVLIDFTILDMQIKSK